MNSQTFIIFFDLFIKLLQNKSLLLERRLLSSLGSEVPHIDEDLLYLQTEDVAVVPGEVFPLADSAVPEQGGLRVAGEVVQGHLFLLVVWS